MIIKKNATTALTSGALLALALVAAPLHADEATTDANGTVNEVQADPTIAGEDTVEEAEAMAAEAEKMEGEMEGEVESAAMDVADDDEFAASLQQQLDADPELGAYGLDVIEADGRYSVTGMIDDSEDYAQLEQMIGDVTEVDPSMIDNNVVVQ